MKHIARRELLRGTGVAALAAAGGAALPFVANASDDPLLSLLNRFLAEQAWIDSYHADLDGRRDELGWDRVNELLDEAIDAYHARCKAMLKAMVRLPAGAASSIVILNIAINELEEGGGSIWDDYYRQLLKSVSNYIAAVQS
jgi:hypothetical protein